MRAACTAVARCRRAAAGFTLLELMTVLVVVAVLSAIAIPSYRAYSLRAHRTEAKTALLELAANQERYYARNGRTFTAALAGLGMPATTPGGRYRLAVTAADPAGFTATATAIGSMAADTDCRVFAIDARGVRTATPDPNRDCW